jgi:hypothetical protein
MSTSLATRRRDLHNPGINFAAVMAGQRGYTHVASGRVCRLLDRHLGPCDLRYLSSPARPTPTSRGPSPTASAPTTDAPIV